MQLAASYFSNLPLGGLPGDCEHAEGAATHSAETPAFPRVAARQSTLSICGRVHAPELLVAENEKQAGPLRVDSAGREGADADAHVPRQATVLLGHGQATGAQFPER